MLTKKDLKESLINLGLRRGMVVYVQSSLKPLGYVVGGAQTIIDALMEVIGFEGTLVMPAFTKGLCDPSALKPNTIPRDCFQEFRVNALPFQKKLTIPHNMGEVVSQFMRNEGVLRSNHPIYSFFAWGKYAKLIVEKHPLHFGLSKDSPLGKVVELNGYVLLMGMSYDKCTVFHQAQYNAKRCPLILHTYPIEKGHRMEWIKMLDLDLNAIGYKAIGEQMENRRVVKQCTIGKASCRLFSAKEALSSASLYLNGKNNEII